MNQKNLENFAEKISHLDTLENCENTLYRLVPNLPNEKSQRQLEASNPGSRGSNSPTRGVFANTFAQSQMNFGNESLAARTATNGFNRRIVKPFMSS